jgi:RNA polymerase sigma-70 factor (ECF subfamily)
VRAADQARQRFGELWRADQDAAGHYLDQLAVAAAGGDRVALEALLGAIREHGLAKRMVTRVLIDVADIDDALQLMLIGVAERIGSYQGRGPFLGWLGRLAHNEALSIIRRKKRKNEPSGAEVPEQYGYVARLSSFVANADAVQRLIDSLPPHYREPLVLRELDGYGYDEIAQRLALPVGTVRSRLARAREQLARQARAW